MEPDYTRYNIYQHENKEKNSWNLILDQPRTVIATEAIPYNHVFLADRTRKAYMCKQDSS